MRSSGVFLAIPAILVLAACSGGGAGGDAGVAAEAAGDAAPTEPDDPGGDAGEPDGGGTPSMTWLGGAGEIVVARCAICHRPGDVAPFPLTTYEEAYEARDLMRYGIETGIMPPWPPDGACREYEGERSFRPGEREAVLAWLDAGAPEGEPGDAGPGPSGPADPPAELPPPDLVASPFEPYLPPPAPTDDYRCFPLDLDVADEMWVRGFVVRPGAVTIVHHVLVYGVDPDAGPQLDVRDQGEGGPGYTCFGGPGVDDASLLGAWVPGTRGWLLPEGEARVLRAGSRLVMQVHYNVVAGGPALDLTTVDVHLAPTEPAFEIASYFVPHADIEIPPGEADWLEEAQLGWDGPGDLEVVGVAGHMHLRGKSFRLSIERADGGEECLLHLPRWDFQWQEGYRFPAGAEAVIHPGDEVRISCVYDNSAENQPLVDGEQVEPVTLTWGEGTLEEMCLGSISIRTPYVPAALDVDCPGFDACRSGCEAPDSFGCLANCGSYSDACAGCVLQGMATGCAAPCVDLGALEGCVDACLGPSLGHGTFGDCMAAACAEEYEALESCLAPLVAAGDCDSLFDACSD